MSHIAIPDDVRPVKLEQGDSTSFYTRFSFTNPFELVFWMIFLALILLTIYVEFTRMLDLHWLFIIYSVAVATVIVGRYIFFSLHRPQLLPRDECNFSIHVIVPCYNESKKAYVTAKSIASSIYGGKFTATFVNDGSADDTSLWLDRVEQEFGFRVIDLPDNIGKRKAISAGFENQESDITILMDADVTILDSSLAEIVRGFNDEKIGAVCGNTGVGNPESNYLTRMQELYYYLSYGLFRAAESYFRTVNCCTGSFSAYRTRLIAEVSDEWANQTFLGRARTFGEDRSMTRMLLRNGYDTVYQPFAKAMTVVPDKLGEFVNQQSRWRRGFMFETFSAASHMWKRPAGAALMFYMSILLALLGPVVIFYCLFMTPVSLVVHPFDYLTAIFLITALHHIFFSVFKEAGVIQTGGTLILLSAIPLWVFMVLILIPITLFTLRNNHWLTRGNGAGIRGRNSEGNG